MLVFLILLSICSFSPKAQKSHHLEFTLNGIQFEKLRIGTLNNSTGQEVLLWGTTKDKCKWTFEIPDSLWQNMTFLVLGKGDVSKKIYDYIHLTEKSDNIPYSRALNSHITPDRLNVNVNAKLFNIDTVLVNGYTLIHYDFIAIPEESSGIKAMLRYPDFCVFHNDSINENLAYAEQLKSYIQAVKACPDSRFLSKRMSEQLKNFRSSKDAKLVFDCFSDSIKKSKYGKYIETGLKQDWTNFENVALKNVLTDKDEKVIQDNMKYNLICFTASWCEACRNEIPLLKQIYKDLKPYPFEMVYISVDQNEKYMSAFKKLVVKDSIPWGSLFSYPQNIEMKYQIYSFPTNMLVYPDNHVEFMDVRVDAIKNKLYRLVKGES